MLSASTIWLIFAAYFAFLIIVAAVVTQREKKQAQGIQLQTGKFSWPILVMTYIASCMSVWVFFAGPGAYYRSGIGYYFSELSYLALFPILCYFTMTKVWLVNQEMTLRLLLTFSMPVTNPNPSLLSWRLSTCCAPSPLSPLFWSRQGVPRRLPPTAR